MMIILFFILLSGIYGLDINKSNGVDVLKTLKTKTASCDLHNFVKSIDNSEDEYIVLIHDLTKYCSNSESTKAYRLLCYMILIELEIGCLLPNNSHLSRIKYTVSYTSRQICSINRIELINNWIWDKLPSNEKEQIDSTSLNLCFKITSLNDTLRLARFFYKIAQRIIQVDTDKNSGNLAINKIQSGLKKTNNSDLGLFEPENQLSINKIREDSKTLNQSIGNKLQNVLELKQENINDSVNGEDVLNIEQNDRIHQQGLADLKKENKTKKSEEGLPLGRAGEKPEREQINERPKPKALDVESVFKANGHQERNWVEGKDVDNQLIDNHLPRMKEEDNPSIIRQPMRKRPPFKLKFNRRYDDNDDNNLSNHFVTSALVFILCIIIIYLILHNKNKVLGLIIEGYKRRRTLHGRRTISHHTRLSQSTV